MGKNKIHLLSPEVVKQIAAGEVVDRPVSIVKELIENSLDAGAKNISVDVISGGTEMIKISDDGSGMNKSDLEMSVMLHATSKLSQISDLDQINSLGFRGEALASIAAVTDLQILTCDGNESHELIDNEIKQSSRAKGTTTIVTNLFRSVPARRKFLKSARAEELAIRNLIKQFALNFPEIGYMYTSDGKEVYKLPADSLRNRICKLYNLDLADIIEITTNIPNFKLNGFITSTKLASRKPAQFLSINNRIVRSSLISAAVKQAYADKIPRDVSPSFFLKFQIDGTEVDVNIHPRKEEVKFSADKEIFHHVYQVVQETLANHMRAEFAAKFTTKNPTPKTSISTPTSSITPRSINNYTPKASYKVDQTLLFSKALLEDAPKAEFLPPSKRYYQVFSTYIIVEENEKLIVVDQHAAAERVNYEKIKIQMDNGGIPAVPLLINQVVSLPSGLTYEDVVDGLEKLGFKVSEFGEVNGEVQLQVNAVPALLLNKLNLTSIFRNILLDFAKEEVDLSALQQKLDLVCATIACHASIRAGDELSQSQIEKLITDLSLCHDPYTCPHGRPTSWEISRYDLEKKFLRVK